MNYSQCLGNRVLYLLQLIPMSDTTMSKRPFPQLEDHPYPPNKYRRTNTANAPIIKKAAPAKPVLLPTPEKSPRTGSSTTTTSKPDPRYEVPELYPLVWPLGTLGTGGQARAVLVQVGSKQYVAKYFKKEKYCIREARIIRQVHCSADSAADG